LTYFYSASLAFDSKKGIIPFLPTSLLSQDYASVSPEGSIISSLLDPSSTKIQNPEKYLRSASVKHLIIVLGCTPGNLVVNYLEFEVI
jgi:hypothetical protein